MLSLLHTHTHTHTHMHAEVKKKRKHLLPLQQQHMGSRKEVGGCEEKKRPGGLGWGGGRVSFCWVPVPLNSPDRYIHVRTAAACLQISVLNQISFILLFMLKKKCNI